MNNAYTGFSPKNTPITEPIPGKVMVENNTGGYVYELTPFKVLERFLILGSEGGSYYTTEAKLTRENALNVIKAIETDGVRAVDLIVQISESGRAPKNDPAIFALALAASANDPKTRSVALGALPRVCRIPTHLFHFLTYVKQFRGFGRGLKTAIGNWYNNMPVEKLAYEVVKYQQRDGWSNADALRLGHPVTGDPLRHATYRWCVDGIEEVMKRHTSDQVPSIIKAFETAKEFKDSYRSIVDLIKENNLSREMLPTEALTRPEVWEALLPKMGLTAMIRNLGNMSKVGLLKPMSDASRLVVSKLQDKEAIKKAKVHPISILIAARQYGLGQGFKGSGVWDAVPAVIDALDDAFYLAFDTLEPTGKRFLFGVDVSGSMGCTISPNCPITAAEGAAAMALACAKTEREFYIMGFSHKFVDLKITPKMRLADVLAITRHMNFGSTNCSLPMEWARENNVGVDCFIVITDNEVNQGRHPSAALKAYRDTKGIQAKQVVMGMTATKFTIADPADPLTLDVVGFDAGVPAMLQEFAKL